MGSEAGFTQGWYDRQLQIFQVRIILNQGQLPAFIRQTNHTSRISMALFTQVGKVVTYAAVTQITDFDTVEQKEKAIVGTIMTFKTGEQEC